MDIQQLMENGLFGKKGMIFTMNFMNQRVIDMKEGYRKGINAGFIRTVALIVLTVSGLVILIGGALVFSAYKFGNTCLDNSVYESVYTWLWIVCNLSVIILPYFLTLIGTLLLLFRKRFAIIKLMLIVIVLYAEISSFELLVEPLNYYTYIGFAKKVSAEVDIEKIQVWLENAELPQTRNDFESIGNELLPRYITVLNPKFVSIYNYKNNRAIRLSYGNRTISDLFGFVVTAKSINFSDIENTRAIYPPIKDLNENCYIWSSQKMQIPVVARIGNIKI